MYNHTVVRCHTLCLSYGVSLHSQLKFNGGCLRVPTSQRFLSLGHVVLRGPGSRMVGARPVVDGPPTKERMGIKRRHVQSTLIGHVSTGVTGVAMRGHVPAAPRPPNRSQRAARRSCCCCQSRCCQCVPPAAGPLLRAEACAVPAGPTW